MPRATRKKDSLSLLFDLQEAVIDGVSIAEQPVEVDPQDRSRYTTIPGSRRASVGMGYVKGICAVLCGLVMDFEATPGGTLGRATLFNSTHPNGSYQILSWDMRDPARILFGGFAQQLPSYEVVILHLIACITDRDNWQSTRWSSEVVERWKALLVAMTMVYPYTSKPTGYWDCSQLQDICHHATLGPYVNALADALYFSLRYQLPGTGDSWKREAYFFSNDIVPGSGVQLQNTAGIPNELGDLPKLPA